jgi:two-component system OmpR family response regulator
MSIRALVADDDPVARVILARALPEWAVEPIVVADGVAAWEVITSGNAPSLAIMDWEMPGLDGPELCRRIRGNPATASMYVILLTSRDAAEDVVAGLDAGADDYLVKPFAFAELLARINALARRPPMAPQVPVLKVNDLELDRLKRTVTRAGRQIELQPQEFKLLEYLMRNAGQLVTRTMLLENVWDFHFDPRTSVVETHISRLRAKVDRGFAVELIHTLRGSGYCIREPR